MRRPKLHAEGQSAPAGVMADGPALPLDAARLILDKATNELARTRPRMSAAQPVTGMQRLALAVTVAAIALSLVCAPRLGLESAFSVLAIPFAFVVFVRVVAIAHLIFPRRAPSAPATTHTTGETDLPAYTLLVPLYREAEVAAQLLAATAALDYPRDRLEALLITEENDEATRRALLDAGLPAWMRILTVPEGVPKTKPRALNYALAFATGDLIAVFDAEDVPEPGQLRAAVAAFRAGGPDLACVQARLNIYNPGRNFLTRQFTLEYAGLFDAILPAFERLNLPLPLGGTSNHFPRHMIEAAGAWDPYNVTEDADLGIRLARLGKRTAMLGSVTWEEAPAAPSAWLGQRTRWIKGWMQTYLVHMRAPGALLRDLGLWRFAGFQIIFGGLILSAIAHPLVLLGVLHAAARGTLFATPAEGWHAALWYLAAGNLAASYVAAAVLAALAVARRGGTMLMRCVLGIPLYWLAISIAAYLALVDLIRRPHFWAKTPHAGDCRVDLLI